MEAAANVLHEFRFAAEEMGAAGNIQHQAMRRIERHQWRPAIAEIGQPFETGRIGRHIERRDAQVRHAGTRIGQHQARRQPQREGALIDRDKTQSALLLVDDSERRLWDLRRFCAMRPRPQPVGRQKGRPEGEIASGYL